MEGPREKLVADYPEVGETPSTIRAFVHVISTEELRNLFGKLPLGEAIDIRDASGIPDSEFFSIILKYLKRKDKGTLKLTRGDLIYLEPELGYRNSGKYIFDGKEIKDLNYDIDPSRAATSEVDPRPCSRVNEDYGSIPEEFQVITEFPIHYWDNRIEHNTLVPFNFKNILGKLNVLDVKRQTRFPYVSFIQDGETYTIAADIDNKIIVSNEEFLDICVSSKYFDWEAKFDDHFRTSNLANVLYIQI
jgi:hypothetical protein